MSNLLSMLRVMEECVNASNRLYNNMKVIVNLFKLQIRLRQLYFCQKDLHMYHFLIMMMFNILIQWMK